MRALACSILLAATATAQVRAVTGLPEVAVHTVAEVVRRQLPDIVVTWTRRAVPELWDAALRARPLGADLLVGVDAQVLELLAADGALAQLGVGLPPGVEPFRVDPGGCYVVPWADAYVIARDPDHAGEGTAPRTLDAMAEARFTDRLFLLAPEAAPSLFVDWVRGPLRDGESSDRVFALLGSVDARVRAWCESGDEAVRELLARPADTFAVAPLSAVRGAGGLAFEPLSPFVPLQGLGVAVCTAAAAPDAARRVAEALFDPAVAHALALEHGILPGIAAEPDGASRVPSFLRDLVERAAPVEPDRNWVRAWFRRFDEDVRDRGRYSENLGLLLDVVFTLLFVAAMFWIYRRSQIAES